MQDLIKISTQTQAQNKVFYKTDANFIIAKGNICIFNQIGSNIDIFWDSIKGNIFLTKSFSDKFSYQKYWYYQIFKNVEFRHAHICPYMNENIQKSQKFYKPCACVMLKNEENILITRRKLTLNSFPGAWVLPGGHLQMNQGLIQGGLRQTSQQIGLNIKNSQVVLSGSIMAWQSAYCKDNKILSSNFVVFFPLIVKQFQVKAQQTQVEQYLWKNILDIKDQVKYDSNIKDGYGQAHLNYLSFYRRQNYNILQTKPWIIKEKNIQINHKL